MTTTTTGRIRFGIPRRDIEPGQVIRNFEGEGWTVMQSRWIGEPGPHSIRSVVMVPTDGGVILKPLWLDRSRPDLFTWLTPEQADQPGHDFTTGRCATCDSSLCGESCDNPWAADRA